MRFDKPQVASGPGFLRSFSRFPTPPSAVAMSLVGEGAALTVLPALTASLAWQDLAACASATPI